MTERQALPEEARIGRLADEAMRVSSCPRCPALVANRTQPVYGTGPATAAVMLVGEAPGREEDLRGEPFIGAAGKRLNQLLEKAGLRRDEVYITNAVKCRPPGNRTPLAEEIANCRPYLEQQIELVRPRVICALGAAAVRSLLDVRQKLGGLRGCTHDRHGIPVVCTYHPAYLLRNPAAEAQVLEDLQLLSECLRRR